MENLEIPSGILALILVLFIFFSAFFSAAETALTGSNKLRLKNIARTGDKRASIVMKLLDSFDRTLTTILIGNNVVNIAAASLAAAVSTAYMGASGLALATVLTTVIILIFGEIIPKDLAKDQPEKYAMKSAAPFRPRPPIYSLYLFVPYRQRPWDAMFFPTDAPPTAKRNSCSWLTKWKQGASSKKRIACASSQPLNSVISVFGRS